MVIMQSFTRSILTKLRFIWGPMVRVVIFSGKEIMRWRKPMISYWNSSLIPLVVILCDMICSNWIVWMHGYFYTNLNSSMTLKVGNSRFEDLLNCSNIYWHHNSTGSSSWGIFSKREFNVVNAYLSNLIFCRYSSSCRDRIWFWNCLVLLGIGHWLREEDANSEILIMRQIQIDYNIDNWDNNNTYFQLIYSIK